MAPVVIGGDNLPSLVGVELTDLPNIGGTSGPPAPPPPPVPALLLWGSYLEDVYLRHGLFARETNWPKNIVTKLG